MIKKTLLSLALVAASASSFAVNLVKNKDITLDYNGFVKPALYATTGSSHFVLTHRHDLTLKGHINSTDSVVGFIRAQQSVTTAGSSALELTKYSITYNNQYGQFSYGHTDTVVGESVSGPGEFDLSIGEGLSSQFIHTFVYKNKFNLGGTPVNAGVSFGTENNASQLGAYASFEKDFGYGKHTFGLIAAGGDGHLYLEASDVISTKQIDYTLAAKYTTFKGVDSSIVNLVAAAQYTPNKIFQPFAKVSYNRLFGNNQTVLSVGSESRVYENRIFKVDVYTQANVLITQGSNATSFGLGAKASW